MSANRPSLSTPEPGFAGKTAPASFNLARYCLGESPRRPDSKTALIICDDVQDASRHQDWTYGALRQAVLRLAAGFSSYGLKAGDRLFIRMGNSIDYALVFFAANAAGLVPVAASSQLTEREVDMLVEDCGAVCLVHDGSLPVPDLPSKVRVVDQSELDRLKLHEAGSFAATSCDDPGFLIYTSGTTSRPKGVLHAQRAVWGRRPMYHDWYEISATDTLLHTGAFNWTYTLGTGLFDPWANGATGIVYTGARDITVWSQLTHIYKPTIMASVPGLYRQILKYDRPNPGAFGSLRHCLCAGEALQKKLQGDWLAQTGLQLCEAFGMSEISTYISTPPRGPFRAGSPGRPQAGRCVAILPQDGGETPVERGTSGIIAVHKTDPGMMLGYWQRPKEEARQLRGDWLLTGDTGHMDDEGFIWFEGRNDDIMNAMGYRVSPIEIEEVLSSHPAIAEVGVRSVAVRDDVEVITAFVVAAENAVLNFDDIAEYAAKKLAAYKVPRKYVALSHLPRNAAGKLMRKRLQDEDASAFEQTGSNQD